MKKKRRMDPLLIEDGNKKQKEWVSRELKRLQSSINYEGRNRKNKECGGSSLST